MNSPSANGRAELMAKCNASVGLLEAAMHLIGTAQREGPKREHDIANDTVAINRQIARLQSKLLRIHDEAEKANG